MRALVLILMVGWLLAGCVGTGGKQVNSERAAELNIKLGLNYLEQGRLDLAQNKLERAYKEMPKSSRVNWANALLYERLGEKSKAESYFKEALYIDPKDSEANNNYGAFLCRENRVKEALKKFEDAAANPLYHTPEYALTNAGLCVLQHDDSVRAEDYFRRALDHNTRYASALYQMALLTYEQKRYLTSRAYRQRLAAVMKGLDPKLLWLCVVTERAMSNYVEADGCEKTLKTEFPASREASQLY